MADGGLGWILRWWEAEVNLGGMEKGALDLVPTEELRRRHLADGRSSDVVDWCCSGWQMMLEDATPEDWRGPPAPVAGL